MWKITNRIYQLDALRGLAALSVVMGHCLGVFPIINAETYSKDFTTIVSILTYSPLHLFWAAHEAVVLFFVLSGFVLALPYFGGRQLKYSQYIIKRLFRIYIPYLVSLIISVVLLQLLSDHGVDGLSNWFNGMWKYTPDFAGWMNLLFMVNTNEAHNINTVTWTLVYEIKISIIFPLLVFFVKRVSWKLVLFVSVLLIFTKSNFLHFSILFIFGALLAKYHGEISLYFTYSNKFKNIKIMIVGLILYLFQWLIPLNLNQNFLDLISGIGASLFIALALGDNKLRAFLLKPPLIYLGKISYSLYLVHPIVLLTAIYSLRAFFPIYSIVAFVPLVSLIVAHFYNKFIENPAITVGRQLILFKCFNCEEKPVAENSELK